MNKTEFVINEIKKHRALIKYLERDMVKFFIHPACRGKMSEKVTARLQEKGWVVTNYMVPREGYFGFGLNLAKHKEDLTDWDRKFLSKHEDNCLF